VHYVRFLLLSNEVARFVFGQASLHPRQDLGVLAIGIELLQLLHQSGALGRVWECY